MAADTASAAGSVPCPDPSVHQHAHGKGTGLSEAASTAALIASNNHKGENSRDSQQQQDLLDADGRLSSRSAATSLKHANARDLPSFPSTGNTAGSATKAALLASDYKMQELWHPEQSQAGSKAALLAQQKGAKLDLWEHQASAEGQSAATLAFRNKGLGPEIYQGNSADSKSKALQAATISASHGRQRAGSTPIAPNPAYPDSANATANALSAATASARNSTMGGAGWDSPANQAARIINSKTDRGMYTSDIHFESEDDKHQAALRASAMSMAKQIYATQNRSIMVADPDGGAGAEAAMSRNSTGPQADIKLEAMRYIHLQEAAHKLAAERLAKVDKNLEDQRYRQYYGYDDKPKRLSRMSMKSSAGAGGSRRGRNRANSESTRQYSDDSDDEAQASRIRSQMSKLNSGINTVDAKKQQDDRARLMALAEKRVSARMQTMDDKVFAETGKVSPAMQAQWETKAREKAEKDRELRAQNPGQTHIGGGKFMADSEIEAIAAARLKPTMDAINDTAEQRRARDEELRQQRQEEEKVRMEETAKKQAQKAEFKKIKDHDKAIAQKEKEEEKARKNEEKQRAKEEQRKSRDVQRDTVTAGTLGADDDDAETSNAGVERHRSALARLKDKFRKSGTHADVAHHHSENKPAPAVVPATATAGEDADPKEKAAEIDRDDTPPPMPISPVTVREDAPRPSSEVSDSKWKPVAVPSKEVADDIILAPTTPAIAFEDTDDNKLQAARPTFETQPSLSGLHGDHLAATDGDKMPNLERHISTIPDSDSSDSDSSDDERTSRPENKTLGETNAQVIANRVVTAPTPSVPGEAPLPTSEKTDETLPASEASREAVTSIETPAVASQDVETKSTPSTATTALPAVPKTSAAEKEKHVEEPTADKDKKGVRGLFSKLRHRRDASESTSKTETPAMASTSKSSTGPTSSTKKDTSKIPEAAGALTFPVDHDLSTSSSSDDEDDRRGRTGRNRQIREGKSLGFGNSRTTRAKEIAKEEGTEEEEGEEEQFEEARDHFDESLAPPPAFGAEGKKSSSPSRETKFVEEL
ncbi:unnamed protein product [Zymoseptoria tritici ST99CH_3D1]|nr:unnamed protein product [Zymoseptoria tritici ST99CH_3D1]